MMLHAFYLTVRHRFELMQKTEIEDPAEVVLFLEPCHIGIGRVLQMGGTQQTMRTDGASACAGYAAQVPRIGYIVK